MGREIVIVAGSPSVASRSSYVASRVAREAERAGYVVRSFALTDFDAADVLFGRFGAPSVVRFVDAVRAAVAIVLASPVYKATYAGGLKAILDLVPPDALAGKAALGIATTRLAAHGDAVDRAYRALFAFFGLSEARTGTLVIQDDALPAGADGTTASPEADARILGASQALIAAAAPDR